MQQTFPVPDLRNSEISALLFIKICAGNAFHSHMHSIITSQTFASVDDKRSFVNSACAALSHQTFHAR